MSHFFGYIVLQNENSIHNIYSANVTAQDRILLHQ
jgi:hypothetical protein